VLLQNGIDMVNIQRAEKQCCSGKLCCSRNV